MGDINVANQTVKPSAPNTGFRRIYPKAAGWFDLDENDVETALTPVPATEDTPGILEVATQAETDTGTADDKLVTPLKLATFSGIPKKQFDAIVALTGGDYTLPSAAFDAGHKRVWIRAGTYLETADIIIPQRGMLVGEAGVIIDFNNTSFHLTVDGNSGITETTGTFDVTSGSKDVTGTGTVFTNLGVGSLTDTYLFIGPDAYEIDSVASNTSLTLVNAWQGPDRTLGVFATVMDTDAILANFFIKNSIDPNGGLFFRAARKTHIFNVTVESCTHNVIIVDSANMLFDKLTSLASFNDGIDIDTSRSLQFAECHFFSAGANGAAISGGLAHKFNDCEFSSNTLSGVRVDGSATDVSLNGCGFKQNLGIGAETIAGTARTNIVGCTIAFNGGDGINFTGSNNGITGNIVASNDGIGIFAGDNGVIVGNHIQGSGGDGIALGASSRTVVVGNRIHNNTGDGISIVTGDDNTLTGNVIENNSGTGILIEVGAANTVLGSNRVFANTTAQTTDNSTSTIKFTPPTINVSFGFDSTGANTTSETYAIIARIIWPGTDLIGFPSAIDVLANILGATDGQVRIFDADAGLQVAESATFTNDPAPAIISMGALSNLSAGPAIWEIQAKRSGSGSQSVNVHAFNTQF